jgi:putative transposase
VLDFISAILVALRVFFRGRRDSALEILALRQQVAVFKRKHPCPKLNSFDRLFWTILRHSWPGWIEALIIVKPDTVVRWHRTGFRLYWRWRSRAGSGGRAKITAEIQALIRRMAEENPDWGAPKIHGELSTSRKGPWFGIFGVFDGGATHFSVGWHSSRTTGR